MLIKKIVNYIKLRRVHKIDVLLPYDPINCKCVFEPLPADNIRVIDGNVPKHNHSLDAIDAMRYSMEYFKNKEEKTMEKTMEKRKEYLVTTKKGGVYLVYAYHEKQAVRKVAERIAKNNSIYTGIITKTEECLDFGEYISLVNMYTGDAIAYVSQMEFNLGLYGDYENTSITVIS